MEQKKAKKVKVLRTLSHALPSFLKPGKKGTFSCRNEKCSAGKFNTIIIIRLSFLYS